MSAEEEVEEVEKERVEAVMPAEEEVEVEEERAEVAMPSEEEVEVEEERAEAAMPSEEKPVLPSLTITQQNTLAQFCIASNGHQCKPKQNTLIHRIFGKINHPLSKLLPTHLLIWVIDKIDGVIEMWNSTQLQFQRVVSVETEMITYKTELDTESFRMTGVVRPTLNKDGNQVLVFEISE